ncbi:TPR domain protein in aerotolerance operon [Aequoribacter fuscus]|uniref:TPR domain protein in aerotolerance operon n=1 Tax=Aequoribacter fuscus TaxID=2518989 RepID=F3L411_9GAMM|nr:tetratricopeptide repeat protein [Aequoribacter fuscus]EGG28932.1 TPR domain protein in aerotolerance operon [Aequoribacter fuscus]
MFIASVLVWAFTDTQSFVNLWLTPDQQGRLWFELGDYQRAARTFENPRWQGFSLYAAEDFDEAANYFSRFKDAQSLLTRANALAHQREYIPARRAYQELAKHYPDHPALKVNLPIIEQLIKDNQRLSESQASERGELNPKTDEGPKSSEGSERQSMEVEQLSADELLQDPNLTDMWLRQIQRDPSEFLSTKFYLQLEQDEKEGKEAKEEGSQ